MSEIRAIANDDGGYFVLGTHDREVAAKELLFFIGADDLHAAHVRPETARLDWFKAVPAADCGTYYHGDMKGVRGAIPAVFWDYDGFILGLTPDDAKAYHQDRFRASMKRIGATS